MKADYTAGVGGMQWVKKGCESTIITFGNPFGRMQQPWRSLRPQPKLNTLKIRSDVVHFAFSLFKKKQLSARFTRPGLWPEPNKLPLAELAEYAEKKQINLNLSALSALCERLPNLRIVRKIRVRMTY